VESKHEPTRDEVARRRAELENKQDRAGLSEEEQAELQALGVIQDTYELEDQYAALQAERNG